jgi:hypothetical protein
MNKQITFTDAEYAQRKLTGGWEKFLDTMDAIVPRAVFEEKIAPISARAMPPFGSRAMNAAPGARIAVKRRWGAVLGWKA